MLCKKTKKTVRTRHYTGGKFYLKIRWSKILGGTFWCKSFGGQHGKNRNHSKFVTAFPASFRPKNSSDCKEVLLNEIGGQGRLQQLQKSSLVSGGVLFLLPSQDVMSYLKSPAFRKYSIFFWSTNSNSYSFICFRNDWTSKHICTSSCLQGNFFFRKVGSRFIVFWHLVANRERSSREKKWYHAVPRFASFP